MNERNNLPSILFWLGVIVPTIVLYLWKPAWPEGIGRHQGWEIAAGIFVLGLVALGWLLREGRLRLRAVAAVSAGLLLYLFLEGAGLMLAHDLLLRTRSETFDAGDYLTGGGFNLLFNIPAVLFFLATGALFALCFAARSPHGAKRNAGNDHPVAAQPGFRCAQSGLRSHCLDKSPSPQQRVRRRQPAAEGDIGFFRLLRAAGGIDEAAQLLGRRLVENVARLLEGAEGIGVEHLRPHVAVIGRGIAAAGEDMREMRRPVAHDDLVRHADPVERRLLERGGVEALRRPRARCNSRSSRAEATYSTVAKPWLKVRAARSRLSKSSGIGSPVRKCTANSRRTSGRSSQCS